MQTKHLRILLLIVIAVIVGACNMVASTRTAPSTSTPELLSGSDDIEESIPISTIVVAATATEAYLQTSTSLAMITTPSPNATELGTIQSVADVPTNTNEPEIVIITPTRDPNATWTPYATSTPYPSLTPCPLDAACPTLAPNDDQLRATQIIVGATGTQEYILTATMQAMMTYGAIEPAQHTATAQAVTSIIRGEPFPYPTMTLTDEEQLRQSWFQELTSAVGFNHPELERLTNELLVAAREEIEFANNSRYSSRPEFSLNLQVERVLYEGDTYVALITRDMFFLPHTRFMMFRVMSNHTVVYIPDPIVAFHNYIMSFYWNSFGGGYLGGFMDRNGNGYPDLAIDTTTEGNGSHQYLVILEIQAGGLVVDITPESLMTRVRRLVDVNDDGILEVESWGCADHEYFDCWKNTNIYRYFGWNGTAYVNISSTLGDEYYPAVNAFWNSVQPDDVCILPSAEMYAMLVDYIAWEQLYEGWTRLEPVLRWDACSPEVLADQQDEMLELYDWVSRYLVWSTSGYR